MKRLSYEEHIVVFKKMKIILTPEQLSLKRIITIKALEIKFT